MSEHFVRLGMTNDMRRRINEWCARNADEETGKMPSFSEGCRQLIERGLGGARGKKPKVCSDGS